MKKHPNTKAMLGCAGVAGALLLTSYVACKALSQENVELEAKIRNAPVATIHLRSDAPSLLHLIHNETDAAGLPRQGYGTATSSIYGEILHELNPQYVTGEACKNFKFPDMSGNGTKTPDGAFGNYK